MKHRVVQYIDYYGDKMGGGAIFAKWLNIYFNYVKKIPALILSTSYPNKYSRYNEDLESILLVGKNVKPFVKHFVSSPRGKRKTAKAFAWFGTNIYLIMKKYDILQIHGSISSTKLPFINRLYFCPICIALHLRNTYKKYIKKVVLTLHAYWTLVNLVNNTNNIKDIALAEKMLFDNVDDIIAVELYHYNVLREQNMSARIHYIPSASVPKKLVYNPYVIPNIEIDEEILNKIRNKIKICLPSRLEPERNIIDFVRQYIKAINTYDYVRRNTILLIAGSGSLENLIRHISEKISNIIYLGALSHIEVLSMIRDHCDIVVNTAKSPGTGRITIEAFTFKKPVLRRMSIDINPIVDGVNGIVYSDDDIIDKLVDISLMRYDLHKLGEHGQETVKKRFLFEDIAEKYMNIYNL
ncbi:glycosyltransferase family 4 protein [Pyrodictium abyssi]|uniref:Glycosyl transferase family 1 domain-containing protein n=1 Tax=Pyrodictium abyssi TaxID=54256 RepID=A0ABM8IXW0_9CREN|nr:hypothetical protein PABY_19440 [Pyrodictium abyssi]